MKEQFDNFHFFKKLAERVFTLNLGGEYSDKIRFGEKGGYTIENGALPLFNVAQMFVKMYYKPFGEDFLREQRHLLNNSQSKLLTFFLDISSRVLFDMSEDYENDLITICEDLNVDYDQIYRKIHTIFPISDRTDFWEYVSSNLFSESLTTLSILTLASIYNETYALVREEDQDEMAEIQSDFLTYVLQHSSSKERAKVTNQCLRIFQTINKFHLVGDFIENVNQILRHTLKRGEEYVYWDKVSFFNGFYHLPQPNSKTVFFHVSDERSRNAFNNLKPYFLKKLPPIHVKIENGKIVKILNTQDLAECITMLERQIIAPPKIAANHIARAPRTSRKNISKSEAREMLKQYKSRFVDTLCNRHLEEYNVVCCLENRINSNGIVSPEYAFIFTIKDSNGLLTLAFENSEDSRCTYLFKTPRRSWQKSIDLIFDFFSSNSVNKRQAMARRVVDLQLPGNYDYHRVMHTDYFKWLDRIKFS